MRKSLLLIHVVAVQFVARKWQDISTDSLITSRNGKTPGITQPSADLQEAVIRKAYHGAKLDLTGTDYVECHGTGTAVGDPIEIEAISRCFSRQEGAPVLIGGVRLLISFHAIRLTVS